MSRAFPGLGFDPAPGDPEQVRRCAREHARAATELDGLASALGAAGAASAAWRGASATAFTASLAPLPLHLRSAADCYAATAAQLTAWAGELEQLQAQARVLERSAEQAVERIRAAHARAAAAPVVVGALVVTAAHAVDVAEAQEDLRRVTLRGEEVRAAWHAACRRLAAAIQAAADAAPPLPRNLGELVWDHRVAVSRTANTASFLSLPAMTIPVVGPVVGGALSAVALTGYSALAVHADGSATDVALGAAGVGLGAGASLAGQAAGRAAGPAAGAAWAAGQRALGYAEDCAWVIGTTRSLLGAPAPPPPAPRRSAVPTLHRLLVAPVLGQPSRKRG